MNEIKLKKCYCCKEKKEVNQFTYSSQAKDKLYSYCKECDHKKTKVFRDNNREHIRERGRKHHKLHLELHKEKSKIRRKKHKLAFLCYAANFKSKQISNGEKIKPIELWHLARKQKMKCALSGIKLTNNNISLDHRIAFSNQGKNTIDNIQLVDWNVNIMKNSHSEEDFLKLIETIYWHQASKRLKDHWKQT